MLTETQRRKPVARRLLREGQPIGWRIYTRGALGLGFTRYYWDKSTPEQKDHQQQEYRI